LRKIPLNRWTFERFGLDPSGIRLRIANGGAPKVLCVSLPKAGTHLLERAICLHPRLYRKLVPTITGRELRRRGGPDRFFGRLRPGQVVMAHLRYDPLVPDLLATNGVRPVFMIRDPRDVVVSQVRYALGRPDHWAHDLFTDAPAHAQLRLAIEGDPSRGLRSLADRLDAFSGWLRDDVALVRFEDLIGAEGGGSAERQREVVAAVYRFIGVDADPALVDDVSRRSFSPDSPTFRKGAIGGWRSVFDDELTTLVRDLAGDQIARFGYEP
jgi:Sulfotransferase domain